MQVTSTTKVTNLNADTLDDLDSIDFSLAGHIHSGGDITSGTVGTGYYSAYTDLTAETKIGTGAAQVAAGDHTHAALYQPLDADLTTIAGLASTDSNFIVGSATGWVVESGATARTSLGLGNVDNTALSTWAGTTNITTLGTITTGTWTGTAVAVANGGTGATSASAARTNLGLAIGTNVQAYDADLTTLGGLASTDSNFIVGSATGWVVESGATARTSLGLAIGTNVQAYDADLTTFAGLASTDSNIIVGSATGWVVESGATARTSLGLAIGTNVQAYDAGLTSLGNIGAPGIAKTDEADVWTTVTAPSGALVGTTDTQTLTNKTFTDSTTYIRDDITTSKKLQFQLSGITAATTRTVTVPDANGTLVLDTATQTLTNKTLTSPTINSPVISGGSINNTPIGATVPAAGTFSTLSSASTSLTGIFVYLGPGLMVAMSDGLLSVVGQANLGSGIFGGAGDTVSIADGDSNNGGTVTIANGTTGGTVTMANGTTTGGTVTLANGTVTAGSVQLPNGGLCVDNDGTCATTAGYVRADTHTTNSADIAEVYPSRIKIEAGFIVALDQANPLFVSVYENALTRPVGIVSTAPGVLLGEENDDTVYAAAHLIQVALVGRVPLKVTDENGVITIGDLITPSETRPGFGMKANDDSQNIVGISLTNHDLNKEEITVMVNTNLVNLAGVKKKIINLENENKDLKRELAGMKEKIEHLLKLSKVQNSDK